ncbi:hypothetical protein FVER53590_25978 [Fusarium verticillioides]|nr:hypothetical protein FVER53590_25978 [Fusarium verticillioides]
MPGPKSLFNSQSYGYRIRTFIITPYLVEEFKRPISHHHNLQSDLHHNVSSMRSQFRIVKGTTLPSWKTCKNELFDQYRVVV